MSKDEYNHFYESKDFMHFKLADKYFIKSIIKILNIPAKSYILDVGCGTGKFSKYFADYHMNVIGVDLSNTAIKIARERCRGYKNVKFLIEDATNEKSICFNQNYDVIFCHGFSIFNNHYEKVAKEIGPIVNCLKNNGYFVFGKTSKLCDDSPVQGKSRVDYDIDIFSNIFRSMNAFDIIGQYTLQPHLFYFFGQYAFNKTLSNICRFITKKTKIPLRVYILMKKNVIP